MEQKEKCINCKNCKYYDTSQIILFSFGGAAFCKKYERLIFNPKYCC